jgi:hypothetical protein
MSDTQKKLSLFDELAELEKLSKHQCDHHTFYGEDFFNGLMPNCYHCEWMNKRIKQTLKSLPRLIKTIRSQNSLLVRVMNTLNGCSECERLGEYCVGCEDEIRDLGYSLRMAASGENK